LPDHAPSPGTTPLLLAVMLMLTLCTALPALAALPASQRLTVAFDLAAGTLHGTAAIDLPANTGANLSLDGLTISSMTLDGEALTPDSENAHRVTIAAVASPRHITITYDMTVPPGPMGDGENRIAADGITLAGSWHPRLDADCRFELTALVPKEFTAIAEADQIERHDSPEGRQFHFRFPQPVAAIHLVAGPYEVQTVSFGDGRKLSTYFFAEDRELADRYRDQALAYLTRYQALLGDFPYNHFAIVENRLPSGYAMPTFTLLGQTVVRLPFITATSLGHEILHQWFGNAVMVDYAQGNWSEGLTTYLADQAFAEEQSQGEAFRKEQLAKYQSYVPADNALALQGFMGATGTTDRDRQRVRAVGYNKASMLFHMLRLRIGDEAFFAGLRDFYTRLRYRPAGWDDLRGSFETAGHQELGDFFNQWLERTDIPDFGIENPRNAEKDGQPELRFTLVQRTKNPYQLTLPVTVQSDGKTIVKTIEATDKRTEVAIPLAAPAETVIIDQNYDLMRSLGPNELPPVLSRFAGAAQRLAVVAAPEEATQLFQPLITQLLADGCEVKKDTEVTDTDVAGASVLFLGTSTLSRSLFAQPDYPATGFTVDVRANPLNSSEVAVLVTAADQNQVAAATPKLRHYGKYGFLHFADGRIEEKRTLDTDHGLRITVDEPPRAVETAATSTFPDIITRLLSARVVYVGEGHTTYEDHLLQLRVIRALHQQDPNLAIGMEMFNRSAQPALDDYVAGRIDEAAMLRQAHYFKNWGYDYRLYQDIIRFARRHHLPLIALNQEKNIVSKVFREGSIASLSDEERTQLPPDRDLALPGYQERIHSVFTMHAAPSPDRFKGFLQAQALWDETMAATAADYLAAHPDQRLVVLAGVGHVAKADAIPPRVARRLPQIQQAVVANIDATEADPDRIDYAFLLAPAQLPPAPIMGVVLADSDQGIRVEELSPHGRAKEVGMRADDLILALDGEPVKTVEELKVFMLGKQRGDTVRVSIQRPHTLFPDEKLEKEIPL